MRWSLTGLFGFFSLASFCYEVSEADLFSWGRNAAGFDAGGSDSQFCLGRILRVKSGSAFVVAVLGNGKASLEECGTSEAPVVEARLFWHDHDAEGIVVVFKDVAIFARNDGSLVVIEASVEAVFSGKVLDCHFRLPSLHVTPFGRVFVTRRNAV